MRALFFFLTFVTLAGFAHASARVDLHRTNRDVIFIDGAIDQFTPELFQRALQSNPSVHWVALNSTGGHVLPALSVADEIFRRGLNTVVLKGGDCASACAYLFMAGKSRDVKGQLGVHQIYGRLDISQTQVNLSAVLAALNRYGVDQSVITVMLQTPPDKMYYFKSDELRTFRINRGSPYKRGSTPEVGTAPGKKFQERLGSDVSVQKEASGAIWYQNRPPD